jgi:glucose/arabinose dehydrogenase
VEAHRVPAARATALAVEPGGSLLVGELETGRLLAVDPRRGTVTERGRIAQLDTDPSQRGLLGLAIAEEDPAEVLAALTGTDGRIVVARVADDGATTTVWRGPPSADEANGGRLVALPDGAVAIGIGDLLEPDRSADPTTPNGKVLRIDDGDGYTALAGGLNNPFAIAPGPEGTIWVADNAPGRRPERLLEFSAEADADADAGTVPEGRVVASWTDTRVPSGLAWLDDGRLALCWYATSELRVVDADEVSDLDDPETGALVADDCRYGVVALPGGGLAYAAETEVVLLRPA